jgi:glycosyltransferase involved in cell wall biosynthesis
MNTPKISVIIPVYNSEKYLESALDSVLNQTFQDFEILCIDDGSTDSSKEIIKKYMNEDKRIKYFYQKNQGPGPARNLGLKKSKGKYIAFLDSDDYLEKNALKTTYQKASDLDLDILFFNAKVIYESEKLRDKYGHYNDYYKRKNIYEDVLLGPELFVKYEKNNDFLPHVGFQLIRRKLILDSKNFFIDALHEDNLFTIKNLLLAKKVSHLNQKLYVRRLRKNSIMTSKIGMENVYGYFRCIQGILNFTNNTELPKEVIPSLERITIGMQKNASKMLGNLETTDIQTFLKKLSNEDRVAFNVFLKSLSEQLNTLKDCEINLSELHKTIEKNLKQLTVKKEEISNLKSDLKKKGNRISNLKANLKKKKDTISNLQDTIKQQNIKILQQNKEIEVLKRQLEKLENSKSYKIGKIITYIPRQIKNAIKKFS